MNIAPRRTLRVDVPLRPNCALVVHHAGRQLYPVWSRYAGSEQLRLMLRDSVGAWQIEATVKSAWICMEDEILLRNAPVHQSLVQAGVLSPSYVLLQGPGGSSLILSSLTRRSMDEANRSCEV